MSRLIELALNSFMVSPKTFSLVFQKCKFQVIDYSICCLVMANEINKKSSRRSSNFQNKDEFFIAIFMRFAFKEVRFWRILIQVTNNFSDVLLR